MILGISGSPRKDGVTANAVKKILEESGMESEYISLSGKKLNGCISCLGCVENNKCVINDDFIEIAEAMERADIIVMGLPNYYNIMNGLSHAVLERCYCFRHKGKFILQDKDFVFFSVEYNNTVNSNVLNTAKVFIESNKCNIIDEFTLDAVSQCYKCKEGHNCKVGKVVREHGVVDKITDEIRPKEFCNNSISISRTEETIKKIKEYTKNSKNLKG